MILFFNKQFREENGLINDLAKKIKKSKALEREIRENTEIYTLDNMIVSFDILTNTLRVCAKQTGENILDMDCSFMGGSSDAAELQNARFHMFSNLLDIARKTYEDYVKEAQRQSRALQQLQERQAQLDEAKATKAAAEAAIVEARQRLKSL